MMNKAFSLERIWLLIRSDLLSGYRALLITSAAILGVVLTFNLFTKGAPGENEGYNLLFTLTLLIWGSIIASRAFKELHNKDANDAYLLIPASALEKALARFLPSTFGFVAFVLVLTWVTTALTELMNRIVFGEHKAIFNIFDPWIWKMVIFHYFILHSFFFLGSAWFRNLHLVKTALVIVLTALGCALVYGLSIRIFYAPYWISFEQSERIFGWLSVEFGDKFMVFVNALHYIMPLFCWYAAWLRVRETQVSHGV